MGNKIIPWDPDTNPNFIMSIKKIADALVELGLATATEDLDKIAESIGIHNASIPITINPYVPTDTMIMINNKEEAIKLYNLSSDQKDYLLGNPEDIKHGIREDPIKKTIEFYIAGYTKRCFGYEVQNSHELLAHYSDSLRYVPPFNKNNIPLEWGDCSSPKTSTVWKDRLYPLASMFRIQLIPQPTNKVDPNAIGVWIETAKEWQISPHREDIWREIFGEELNEPHHLSGLDLCMRKPSNLIPLGYVPKVISGIIGSQLSKIGCGIVKKIKRRVRKDGSTVCSTKIEFCYDVNNPIIMSVKKPKTEIQRRIELLEVD